MPHTIPKEMHRATGRDDAQLTVRAPVERRGRTLAGGELRWEGDPPRRRRGELFAVAKQPLSWTAL